MTETKERKPRVYLAGPMRGIQEFNFPLFEKASEHLRNAGLFVKSPAERDRKKGFDPAGTSGYEDFKELGLNEDLKNVLKADIVMIAGCDGIVLLPNWEFSSGAQVEALYATCVGIPCFLYDEEAVTIPISSTNVLYGISKGVQRKLLVSAIDEGVAAVLARLESEAEEASEPQQKLEVVK